MSVGDVARHLVEGRRLRIYDAVNVIVMNVERWLRKGAATWSSDEELLVRRARKAETRETHTWTLTH